MHIRRCGFRREQRKVETMKKLKKFACSGSTKVAWWDEDDVLTVLTTLPTRAKARERYPIQPTEKLKPTRSGWIRETSFQKIQTRFERKYFFHLIVPPGWIFHSRHVDRIFSCLFNPELLQTQTGFFIIEIIFSSSYFSNSTPNSPNSCCTVCWYEEYEEKGNHIFAWKMRTRGDVLSTQKG